MIKTRSGKKGLIIGIVLMLILAIAISVEVYIFFCVDVNHRYRDTAINYRELRDTAKSDMLYLSEDFIDENNLEIVPLYTSEGGIVVNVVLEYDTYNASTGFNRNVIKTDMYKYDLVSKADDAMPVRVSIVGLKGNNSKIKYDKEMSNGDKYAVLDSKLTTYMHGIGRSYEVKGQVGKSGAIKKYSRLKITATVDSQYIKNYTAQEMEERVQQVLDSALKHVERYGK